MLTTAPTTISSVSETTVSTMMPRENTSRWPRFLRQHRRVAALIRHRVGGVRQPGDARDQEGDDRPLDDQYLAGVAALWPPQRTDGVGDRLDAGQRGAAVGERPR